MNALYMSAVHECAVHESAVPVRDLRVTGVSGNSDACDVLATSVHEQAYIGSEMVI